MKLFIGLVAALIIGAVLVIGLTVGQASPATTGYSDLDYQRAQLLLQQQEIAIQQEQMKFLADQQRSSDFDTFIKVAFWIGICGAVVFAGARLFIYVDNYYKNRDLIRADTQGLWPASRELVNQGGLTIRALDYYGQASIQRATLPQPAIQTYSPHYSNINSANSERALMPPNGLDIIDADYTIKDSLPGFTDLNTLLQEGWRPTRDNILLGLGPGGQKITVPVGDDMCHVLAVGRTGSGKSNQYKLIVAQLEAVGCKVYILDPHFTDYDETTGDNWASVAQRSALGKAIYNKDDIITVISSISEDGGEIDRRLALRRAGKSVGAPMFYLVDEVPVLVQYDKNFMQMLGRVLREGRKLGIFVIMAAQDALIKTLGGSTGLRDQFQTVYYGGGDPISARAILKTDVDDAGLGRGIAILRSKASIEPQRVRVPLVSNAALENLLNVLPGTILAQDNPSGSRTSQSNPEEHDKGQSTSVEHFKVAAVDPYSQIVLDSFLRNGCNITKTVTELSGTIPLLQDASGNPVAVTSSSGKNYQKAKETAENILAGILSR